MADALPILVAEDDPSLAAALVRNLRRAGFAVELAVRGDQALELARTRPVSLVILDLMLPELDGFAVLERLSAHTRAPVIVVTARTELPDRLRSFSLGAVDFLAKPFWMEELLARVRAHLHLPSTGRRTVAWADVVVDLDARIVTVTGCAVALTPHELALLAYLVERPGRAVSRAQLAESVLSTAALTDERTVDSHISRLRKKLGAAGDRIVTVRGFGYRFHDEGGRR
jgi:DNA-binding response OmpR family regulator